MNVGPRLLFFFVALTFVSSALANEEVKVGTIIYPQKLLATVLDEKGDVLGTTMDMGLTGPVRKVSEDGKWLWVRLTTKAGEGRIRRSDVCTAKEALEYFGERIKQKPDDYFAYHQRSRARVELNDLDGAIADASEVIRIQPHVLNLLWRGELWKQKQDDERALADFNAAIEKNPEYAISYRLRSRVWALKGDFERSMADYAEAIRLDPQDSINYSIRGVTHLEARQFSDALKDFEECIRLNPKHAEAHYNRGVALARLGKFENAKPAFDKALELDPKLALAYLDRGNVLDLTGHPQDALADFDRAIAEDPNLVRAYLNRGMTLRSLGKLDRALADFNRALELDPSFADARFLRADVWAKQREFEKAIEEYKESLRLNPRFSRAANALAWLLATCDNEKYRDGPQAVKYATLACELSEWRDPAFIDTLAAAYAQSGDFAKAVKYQSQALELVADEKKENYRRSLNLYKARKPYSKP